MFQNVLFFFLSAFLSEILFLKVQTFAFESKPVFIYYYCTTQHSKPGHKFSLVHKSFHTLAIKTGIE